MQDQSARQRASKERKTMVSRTVLVTRLAVPAALIALASAALAQTPAGDWATYNRTLWGDRYSPLAEISPANVHRLRPVGTFDVGEPLNFQTGPVVIGGTMY